ncbi:SPASM domain-containing protein [Bradyrhizobium sp. LMG 9283]|uniref:SPASM domain-containing protein n=1 Tax=Bradyrhizobium sp. LMG 9283 TaxID=592064 RepID=UPI00388E5DB6
MHTAQITLDGDKQLHDRTRSAGKGLSSFEAILSNSELAAACIEIKLRIRVAPFSVDRVKRLLTDVAERGIGNLVKELYFAPLFDYNPDPLATQFKSDTKRFFDSRSFAAVELELFGELKRLRFPMPDLLRAPFSVCTAVQENAVVIGPSGNLYICYFELDDSARSGGDVRSGISASDHLAGWLNHEIARDDECRSCKFFPICFGGCTHKWQKGADKGNICTRLKLNADGLLPLMYTGTVAGP